MNPVEVFIDAIDRAWPMRVAPRIELRVLGSSALFLQCDYQRGTKDSDVLETAQVSGDVVATLNSLAGKGTPLHDRHRLYWTQPSAPRHPSARRCSPCEPYREAGASLSAPISRAPHTSDGALITPAREREGVR